MSDELMPTEDMTKQLIEETNPAQLNYIIDLFNLNIRKKDILRASKLSALQDTIVSEMGERISKHSDNFSNKDLLDYFRTIQDTQSKTNTTLTDVNIPTIQINHNEVNMNGEAVLSRESKNKVSQTVQKILRELAEKQAQEEILQVEASQETE